MADFFDGYGPSFLGLQLLRLYQVIDRGGTNALVAQSIGLPSRVASLLIYLQHRGPSSVSELAKALGASHQLVSQRMSILQKEALIKKVADPKDQRRLRIELSARGRKAAREVEALCKAGDEAYRLLFEEIGIDALACVIKARKALEERSLDLRIRDIALPVRKKPAARRRRTAARVPQ